MKQWKSLRFSENLLNFSHYIAPLKKISVAVSTENQWIFTEFQWLTDSNLECCPLTVYLPSAVSFSAFSHFSRDWLLTPRRRYQPFPVRLGLGYGCPWFDLRRVLAVCWVGMASPPPASFRCLLANLQSSVGSRWTGLKAEIVRPKFYISPPVRLDALTDLHGCRLIARKSRGRRISWLLKNNEAVPFLVA